MRKTAISSVKLFPQDTVAGLAFPFLGSSTLEYLSRRCYLLFIVLDHAAVGHATDPDDFTGSFGEHSEYRETILVEHRLVPLCSQYTNAQYLVRYSRDKGKHRAYQEGALASLGIYPRA